MVGHGIRKIVTDRSDPPPKVLELNFWGRK